MYRMVMSLGDRVFDRRSSWIKAGIYFSTDHSFHTAAPCEARARGHSAVLAEGPKVGAQTPFLSCSYLLTMECSVSSQLHETDVRIFRYRG